MASNYDVGDLVRVALAFTDAVGADADPTTVRGRFRDPSGVVTTYVFGTDSELVKDAVGNYYFELSPAASGEWRYRGEGTGAVQAAAKGRFVVRATAFPPAA